MLSITYAFVGSAPRQIDIAETATPAQQTAAIQAALDAVAGQAGGTVTLSAGTFTVVGTGNAADGALRIGSQTTLEGAGMGQTVIKLADGAAGVTGIIRTDSGAVLTDGTITTTSNVTVKNLTIDGNMAMTSGATDGFYCGPEPGTAQHDANITLERVEIMNASRYGFDPHEQTVGLKIIDSVAHHNGVDGIVIDFCSAVEIVNVSAYANGRHGINIVTGSHDVSIVNADVRNNGGSGIVVQTGDNEIRSFTHHVTITGGTVSGNGDMGIDVHQATDIRIDQVTIADNGTHGISLLGVDRADLTGNTITGVPGTSDLVRIDGYLQDFDDTVAANDRYVPTRAVTIDGVAQADPVTASSVPLWSYVVTTGNDTIVGSSTKDSIAAGSGDDVVSGGLGNDILNGEDGNDTLAGNDGNDVLIGGAGSDSLSGGAGHDRMLYTAGRDVVDGGIGMDTIDFSKAGCSVYVNLAARSGFEAWTSGAWRSTATNATTALVDIAGVENVRGSSRADTILGNNANNTLDGHGSSDFISAGGGADRLRGGEGNDILNGGAGRDTLTGGAGNDIFRFSTGWERDTVTDFAIGVDKLQFSGIAGLTGFGNLTITATSAGASIAFGTNSILLQGVSATSLSAGDFLFG